MEKRHERVRELLRQLSAEFIQRESDRSSLITVTNVTLSDDYTNAKIEITVFPPEREQAARTFLNRHRNALREFIKRKARTMRRLPHLEFAIDYGEKNRQRIDELSSELDTE